MGTKLRQRRCLPDEVTEILRAEINSGTFKPGQKLPTEAALAQSFGISRTVVREALARLRYDGMLETRQGRGATVTENWQRRAFRFEPLIQDKLEDLNQLYELRAILEKETASLAAIRRDQTHLIEMEKRLRKMEDAVAQDTDGTIPDFEFHRLIAKASGNLYLIQLMQILNYKLIEQIRRAREHSRLKPELPSDVQKEHEEIFTAIKEKDSNAARHAAHKHIYGASSRLGLTIFDG